MRSEKKKVRSEKKEGAKRRFSSMRSFGTEPGFLGALLFSILTALCGIAGADDSVHTRILTDIEPEQALDVVDSLEEIGALQAKDVFGLRARVRNRPGYWDSLGRGSGAVFEQALKAYEEQGLYTKEDSIGYYALFLDLAYYYSRAAHSGDGDPAAHALNEERCLRRVYEEAPMEWQRGRACMELGRFYVRRSVSPIWSADSTLVAEKYLRMAADFFPGSGSQGPALWYLAWHRAGCGRIEEAIGTLSELEMRFSTTKWAPRARRIKSLFHRKELSVNVVTQDSAGLLVCGSARNLQCRIRLDLERIDPDEFERRSRLPLPGDRFRGKRITTNSVAVSKGLKGSEWEILLPPVEPGVYRLTATFAESVLVYTIGIWDVEPQVNRDSDAITVTVESEEDLGVSAGWLGVDGQWQTLGGETVGSGESVGWQLDEEHAVQLFLNGHGHTGWVGPPLWAPSFEVFLERGE